MVTIERLNGCKLRNCARLAAIFAPKFGIADGLAADEMSQLVSLFDKVFAAGASDMMILAQVKSVEASGFQVSDMNKIWLSRGMSWLASVYFATLDSKGYRARLLGLYEQFGTRIEMYRLNRLYIPFVACISKKDERMKEIVIRMQESLKAQEMT
jgi:hypothetical protein